MTAAVDPDAGGEPVPGLGTVDRADDRRPGTAAMVALLGAPTTWIVVFVIGYLVAEWSCGDPAVARSELGLDTLSWVLIVLGVTGSAVVVMCTGLAVALLSPGADGTGPAHQRLHLRVVAWLLGGFFLLAIVATTALVVALGPCAT